MSPNLDSEQYQATGYLILLMIFLLFRKLLQYFLVLYFYEYLIGLA